MKFSIPDTIVRNHDLLADKAALHEGDIILLECKLGVSEVLKVLNAGTPSVGEPLLGTVLCHTHRHNPNPSAVKWADEGEIETIYHSDYVKVLTPYKPTVKFVLRKIAKE